MKHGLSLQSEKQPCFSKKAKIQKKLIMRWENVKKEDLRSIVSQLAAVDCFSIHSTGKSASVRE